MEDEASLIREWQSQVVPGLLQTQDYARAIIRSAPELTDADVRRRVEARMRRQTTFRERCHEQSAGLHVVIDEPVLRRPIGGTEVMRVQAERLLSEADQPNVTIQVMPHQVEAYAGVDGSFMILDFPEPDDPSVGYTERSRWP
jgi:hypothetical protein